MCSTVILPVDDHTLHSIYYFDTLPISVNMKRILAESETFEELRKAYQNSRDDAAKRAHER